MPSSPRPDRAPAAASQDDGLVERAREVAANSYSPYSGFRVGAAVRTEDGRVFTGVNVENASYPASTCAEATAVATAVSAGARRMPVVAVACVDAEDLEMAYPCGRCRQIMSEFGVEEVLVATGEGPVRRHRLEELLPHRFRL